jgi:hypothetical protein
VQEAIDCYRGWLLARPELIKKAKRELKGKTLACWCKTKNNPLAPCHGDVLLEIANSKEPS